MHLRRVASHLHWDIRITCFFTRIALSRIGISLGLKSMNEILHLVCGCTCCLRPISDAGLFCNFQILLGRFFPLTGTIVRHSDKGCSAYAVVDLHSGTAHARGTPLVILR